MVTNATSLYRGLTQHGLRAHSHTISYPKITQDTTLLLDHLGLEHALPPIPSSRKRSARPSNSNQDREERRLDDPIASYEARGMQIPEQVPEPQEPTRKDEDLVKLQRPSHMSHKIVLSPSFGQEKGRK